MNYKKSMVLCVTEDARKQRDTLFKERVRMKYVEIMRKFGEYKTTTADIHF